jgi:hypothetical protein
MMIKIFKCKNLNRNINSSRSSTSAARPVTANFLSVETMAAKYRRDNGCELPGLVLSVMAANLSG